MTYLATTISAFATALATILVDHALDNGVGALSRQAFIASTAKSIWCDAGAYLATPEDASRLAPPAAIVRAFFKVETLGTAPGNSIVLLKAMNKCFKVYRAQATEEAKCLPVIVG